LNVAKTLEGKWAVVAVVAKEVVEISEETIINAAGVVEVVVVEDTRTAGAKAGIRTMKTEEIATRGAEVEIATAEVEAEIATGEVEADTAVVGTAVAIKEEMTTGEMMDGNALKAGEL
jgi:hypothetical protein